MREIQIKGKLTTDKLLEYGDVSDLEILHTIGDGSCMIHAILQAISKTYRSSSLKNKKDMANEIRKWFNKTIIKSNHVFCTDHSDEKALIYLMTVNGDPELSVKYLMKEQNYSPKRAYDESQFLFMELLDKTKLLISKTYDNEYFIGPNSLRGLLKICQNYDNDEIFQEECRKYQRFLDGEYDIYEDHERYTDSIFSENYFVNFLSVDEINQIMNVFSKPYIYDIRDRIGLEHIPLSSYFTTVKKGNMMYGSLEEGQYDNKLIQEIIDTRGEYLELPHLYLMAQMFDINIICLLKGKIIEKIAEKVIHQTPKSYEDMGYGEVSIREEYEEYEELSTTLNMYLAPASKSNQNYIFVILSGQHYETLALLEQGNYRTVFPPDHHLITNLIKNYNSEISNLIPTIGSIVESHCDNQKYYPFNKYEANTSDIITK
jgi:hypothetical protein